MRSAKCINAGFKVFVFYANRLDRTLRERVHLPWGSSVISSAVTWPKRSRVAWTLELKPFVSLLPASAKLMLPKLDWNFDHPSIVLLVLGGDIWVGDQSWCVARRTYVTWLGSQGPCTASGSLYTFWLAVVHGVYYTIYPLKIHRLLRTRNIS